MDSGCFSSSLPRLFFKASMSPLCCPFCHVTSHRLIHSLLPRTNHFSSKGFCYELLFGSFSDLLHHLQSLLFPACTGLQLCLLLTEMCRARLLYRLCFSCSLGGMPRACSCQKLFMLVLAHGIISSCLFICFVFCITVGADSNPGSFLCKLAKHDPLNYTLIIEPLVFYTSFWRTSLTPGARVCFSKENIYLPCHLP